MTDVMTILLATLAVAFAAFCVWLAVRIINRREKWAKWTLVAVVGLPLLYVASFGPACWISSQMIVNGDLHSAPAVSAFYQPILRLTWMGPASVKHSLLWYAWLWADENWTVGHSNGQVWWGRFELRGATVLSGDRKD